MIPTGAQIAMTDLIDISAEEREAAIQRAASTSRFIQGSYLCIGGIGKHAPCYSVWQSHEYPYCIGLGTVSE